MRLTVSLPVICLLFWLPAASAKCPSFLEYTISGTVANGDGIAIPDASIRFGCHQFGCIHPETAVQTDASGHYVLALKFLPDRLARTDVQPASPALRGAHNLSFLGQYIPQAPSLEERCSAAGPDSLTYQAEAPGHQSTSGALKPVNERMAVDISLQPN